MLSEKQLCRNEPPLPLHILLAYKKSKELFLLLPAAHALRAQALLSLKVSARTFMAQQLPTEAAVPHLSHPLCLTPLAQTARREARAALLSIPEALSTKPSCPHFYRIFTGLPLLQIGLHAPCHCQTTASLRKPTANGRGTGITSLSPCTWGQRFGCVCVCATCTGAP